MQYVMTLNGKPFEVSEEKVRSLNLLDYVLFLNAVSGEVACALWPDDKKIKSTRDAGLGGVQDILAVMMAHPLLFFGHKNIGDYLPSRRGMTPNAFRKAMARLRYALQGGSQEGPLLLHVNRCDFSVGETGHAWRISKEAGDICVVGFLPQAEHGPRQADWGPSPGH